MSQTRGVLTIPNLTFFSSAHTYSHAWLFEGAEPGRLPALLAEVEADEEEEGSEDDDEENAVEQRDENDEAQDAQALPSQS